MVGSQIISTYVIFGMLNLYQRFFGSSVML